MQREVLDTLTNRSPKSRVKYSPETRNFCLRIQFHSTAAYEELRKFFGNRLPACSTLRKWLRCVDASPGITQTAIDELAEKAREYRSNGRKLHLCLISDEMSIRQQVEWDPEKKTFDGFPTEINTNSKRKLPICKEALVFMVVGEDFKISVAYFFLNGLQAIDRAVLTKEVIRAIDNTGSIVISLTGDGLAANVAVAKILGADFNSNRTYFPRPDRPNEKIYVIFDPSHMIKLIRRYFAYHQLYYKDEKLKWGLIKQLAEKQDNDNFALGNKLSRKHVNFQGAPMNVLLAVQTISNSVADAIEQLCEDRYEGFTESERTVDFLRINNNVYDIMNYGNGKPSDDHYKVSLCSENIQKIRDAFLKFEEFTAQMSVDEYTGKTKKNAKKGKQPTPARKCVLRSRSSMGFFGLLTNIRSTLGIYTDYVENGQLDVFYTFQYSQDHLETFFSLIRSNLGWNNNPNQLQFKAAYRKLLVCMPYLSARKGNCIVSSTNILTVSSGQKPAQQSSHALANQISAMEIADDTFHELLNREIEPYEEHLRAFIASTAERNMVKNFLERSKSACQCCLSVFSESPKIHDSFIAKKSQTKHISQPCRSTVDIIAACNVVFELLQPEPYVGFDVVAKTIFNQLYSFNFDELYESEVFDNHQNPVLPVHGITHKHQFIYDVVSEYMHIKSKSIGKRITIEEQNGRVIRRNLTRTIILAGQ